MATTALASAPDRYESAWCLLAELGREIATPDEARRLLDLKGGENVKF